MTVTRSGGPLLHRIRAVAKRFVCCNLKPSSDEQQLLHRYAVWHLLRRLRGRLGGVHTTHQQAVGVQQHVKAAITLLDWLTARGVSLATCRQRDVDAWLTSHRATHRREAGHFVRWANKQKLTRLEFPATKWDGPTRALDTEARWEHARRLLHDNTLKPEDRVAGLLVLLYAHGLPRSAASPSTTFRPATTRYGCGWAVNPSCSPNRWPASSFTSSPPAAATPPSATKEPPHGCSPAGNPAARSAPTS